MSEAYIQGFRKAANDRGFSIRSLLDAFSHLDPEGRKAIIGGTAAGAGTYLMSEGDSVGRLLKAISAGALGGAGIYALNKSVK